MSLHVETLGAGDDLVLLHGWGMHGGVWDAVKPLLAAHFRLHLVDLPGHGASSPLTPATLENLAEAVVAAVPPRAHWCGWSLGGLVALTAARRFPQRIGKLALVAATPCFVQRDDWRCAMPAPTLRAFAGALENAYEDTLKRFLALQARGDEAAKGVLRALREHLFARGCPDPAALRDGLEVLLSTDARPWMAEVTHPVLIVHGERDQLVPSPAASWLADALPNARLAVFPNAAHAPFLSHPHEFAQMLETFLNARQ